MLLDDHLSSYVTKPRATNTISVSAILMCHTESLLDVDAFLLRSPIYLALTLNNLQDVFRRRTRHGKLGGGNPLGRLLRNGRIFLLVPEW